MKRLFALSLVAMMGLTLVACGNVKEDVYEAENEVEEVEATENEAEEVEATEVEAEVEAEEVEATVVAE